MLLTYLRHRLHPSDGSSVPGSLQDACGGPCMQLSRCSLKYRGNMFDMHMGALSLKINMLRMCGGARGNFGSGPYHRGAGRGDASPS